MADKKLIASDEFANLRFQSGTSSLKSQIGISSWGGVRTAPYAFTEQGVSMLSSVLYSTRAIQVNIEIMRAFVRLRQMLSSNAELWIKQLAIRLGCQSPQPSRWLSRKLATLEKKYDIQFKAVFEAIRELMTPLVPRKKRPIGFAPWEKNCSWLL
jgi:hypothetical protein